LLLTTPARFAYTNNTNEGITGNLEFRRIEAEKDTFKILLYAP